MKELNFIQKSRKYNRGTVADIAIGVVQNKGKLTSRITFYNNVEHKIAKDNHIVVAISDNRLYFKSADMLAGYKVTKLSENNAIITIHNSQELTNFCGSHRGYFNLEYDKDYELYYIDCEV